MVMNRLVGMAVNSYTICESKCQYAAHNPETPLLSLNHDIKQHTFLEQLLVFIRMKVAVLHPRVEVFVLNSAISGRLFRYTSYFPLHISVGNVLFLLIYNISVFHICRI